MVYRPWQSTAILSKQLLVSNVTLYQFKKSIQPQDQPGKRQSQIEFGQVNPPNSPFNKGGLNISPFEKGG
jgi:hypothetical protein